MKETKPIKQLHTQIELLERKYIWNIAFMMMERKKEAFMIKLSMKNQFNKFNRLNDMYKILLISLSDARFVSFTKGSLYQIEEWRKEIWKSEEDNGSPKNYGSITQMLKNAQQLFLLYLDRSGPIPIFINILGLFAPTINNVTLCYLWQQLMS